MKLAFFDDFKFGVVAGDSVVDVTDVVKDISRLGPQDVMRGVIERFDALEGQARGCGLERAGQAGLTGKIPSAAAQAREHHLHGGELCGGRHAGRTRPDQKTCTFPGSCCWQLRAPGIWPAEARSKPAQLLISHYFR
jgi:hypothetical protein